MEKYLYIALFAPLLSSVFAGLFGTMSKKLFVGVVTSALIFTSMVASLLLLFYVMSSGQAISVNMMDWIHMGNFKTDFGFAADQISVVMISVVTIVSTIVHVYSIAYMEHDEGFNRFFSYLSLFVFSMMFLVLSDNFLGLFLGWEGVGVCSYLLVGFWYKKRSASWAANEAFIMNRIADLGLILGMALLFWQLGTLKYSEVFANVGLIDHGILTWICILLFVGAMGKSAQFPLHTWLADAMEGPTPVSALIHAATMVTAGVYLVVRANEMFAAVPSVGFFIAALGAFVAMFAASMALVNNDLKRIIAYSTLSQLGYMFVAAGLGAYWVALFHLMTHAFFKALLFLGAGNVMHAMHDELDIRKMSGLYPVMKYTAIMMILASIALAGIYPFAGYFSKDKILEVAFGSGQEIIWLVLLLTAAMTAFYSFRLIMMTFFGKAEGYKQTVAHPHEAYKFVLIAMSPLVVLSVIAGFFEHTYASMVSHLLPMHMPHLDHGLVLSLIALTLGLVIASIAFAVYKYSKGGFSEKWQDTFIYKLLVNQYYIPAIYEKLFTRPYYAISKMAWEIDRYVVDSLVDAIATFIFNSGERMRVMQNGNLSSMLRLMTLGFVAFVIIGLVIAQMK